MCVVYMCVINIVKFFLPVCVHRTNPSYPSYPSQSKAKQKKDTQVILRNIDGLGHLDYHKKVQQLSGSRQCTSHPFHPCSLFCLLSLSLSIFSLSQTLSARLLIMSYLLRQMFATGDRFSCLPWSPMRRTETQKQVKGKGERWMEWGEANKVAFKVCFVMPLFGAG